MRRLLIWTLVLGAVGVAAFVTLDFTARGRNVPAMKPADARATKVLIEKAERRLTLKRGEETLASYKVSLGGDPIGHKLQKDDGRTPEGNYTIDSKNPGSRFHLALHISYPRPEDRANARKLGKPPGGDIMIHGMRNGLGWLGKLHLALDWTDGCVAVTDRQIEEVWALVDAGTPVEIRP